MDAWVLRLPVPRRALTETTCWMKIFLPPAWRRTLNEASPAWTWASNEASSKCRASAFLRGGACQKKHLLWKTLCKSKTASSEWRPTALLPANVYTSRHIRKRFLREKLQPAWVEEFRASRSCVGSSIQGMMFWKKFPPSSGKSLEASSEGRACALGRGGSSFWEEKLGPPALTCKTKFVETC